MSVITFFFIFVVFLASVLLIINLLLAPHIPDKEKKAPFECGYRGIQGQSRSPIEIPHFKIALSLLMLSLEIAVVFPAFANPTILEYQGLVIAFLFTFVVTLIFIVEIAKGTLDINSKQNNITYNNIINNFNPFSK